MVMRFKYLVGIAFCAFLLGCDDAALMRKWTPPGAEANARNYVELLRQQKLERIEHDLDTSVTDPDIRGTLAKMAALFPAGDPESVKVVGAHTFHGQGYSTTDITFEYQFPNKWLLASVTTQSKDNASTVTGLHVNPMADSLENLYKFSLFGKSAGQYLVLICGVCALMFSLYVLVVCVRTKIEKAKWLWILFILVGLVRLAINWTTGEFTFTPLAFNLPCFAATRPLYGPWTVAFYLPVGAILFMNHRRKLKVKDGAVEPPMLGQQ